MKHILIYATILNILLFFSCSKEERPDYTDAKAPAPAQISDVLVKATPGGALVTYQIPKDPNLSFVKAVYETQQGVVHETTASRFTDTLKLDGFGDTDDHEVNIFSVGKNGKSSNPITITVRPLTPPVVSVFQNLELSATFGGINVSFINESEANLALVVIADTTGKNTWAEINTFYTGANEGKFSIRGYDPDEMNFAVYVRDRWQNKSDTLVKALTPLFEEPIPTDKFAEVRLPTDTWQPAEPIYPISNLWDTDIDWYGLFSSSNNSTLPQWFTIDLGRNVVISRFKAHQVSNLFLYSGSAVKTFELWGSNNPDPDGGWNNWTKLGDFKSFKPSGLPLGQTNDDDKNYGHFNGEDFELENSTLPFRYIRFKTLETYGSSGQVVISELSFWGQVID
ncbi:DUF5000 domain-containing lipoprotein [Parapedobacter sp. 10938]|uniref:DUF5000 domain-containing lipoprotein n=1 Tax=Parapedobacter flavus TaxID=3110225 RepID=UPI002DB586BD|nr:DUF5000 domain-containing lipoprotein [Parapedobacter sp. 10938]MEC3879527.1 DUF5000 domain-containing lipoprotein [Parapedobacter sp. 10938]